MSIIVTGRKVTVTEKMREYVEAKVGDALQALPYDDVDTEVVLRIEKGHDLAAICEITVRPKGHVIHVEEADDDMDVAIDIAAVKLLRQIRKYKNRVLDNRMRASVEAAAETRAIEATGATFDELMAEFAAEDEEIVRVKEVDFAPMTEEEALVQIDLLGHDFFGYTDRDSNAFCILYRRANGGYGLLKQA